MTSSNSLQLEENENAEHRYGMTPVCLAIKRLDMNYHDTFGDVTAFIRAYNTENVDMVEFLLDYKDVIELLLANGADYARLRDPPDVVHRISKLLTQHEN